MDFHSEQLIIKQKTLVDYLLVAAIIFVTVLLWIVLFTFTANTVFFNLIFIPIFFIGWGAWKLIQSFDLEYEYEITNQYLDFSKISGKSRRKEVISIDLKIIEICTYVTDPKFNNVHGISKTYDLSGNSKADGRVFIDCTSGTAGKIRIIFHPNDKIKELAKKSSPKTVIL